MKTSDLVNRSSKYSWYYLLLAAILFFLSTTVGSIYGPNVSEYKLMDTKLWLYLAGSFYLINWICGVFYFPIKYRRILNRYWLKDSEHLDMSYMRGYVAAVVALVYFFAPFTELPIWFWPVSIVWICLHVILAQKVRTDRLFTRTTVMIDEDVLLPFLPHSTNYNSRYTDVYYILPLLENKDEWIRKTIVAYASHRRAGYFDYISRPEYPEIMRKNEAYQLKKQLEEREATGLSANIYNYCH